MKTILCYGDSNLWGYVPGSFNAETFLAQRFIKNKRWTGILQKKLGENYSVVEEGINGRTTTLDEIIPGRPHRNGLTLLSACFEAHYPIDLVIFMLGTNDTKIQFNRSPEQIAEGMRELIKMVKSSNKGPGYQAPQVLLIAPHVITKSVNLHEQYDDLSIVKSQKLAQVYEQVSKEEGCEFLNASLFVTSSVLDGVHLDEAQCRLLGDVVVEKVRGML